MTGPSYSRLPRDERRRQILDAARQSFGEGYYSAVSTANIAAAAGVSPALVHHYFGSKRELYLEVVREMLRVPPLPPPEEVEGRSLEEVIGDSVDLWLDLVRANRETWMAALGAEGFGHDPDLERIFEDAREGAAARAIRMLGLDARGEPQRELRAVIRAYSGMAEAATREWLLRRRLSRRQIRVLLTDTLVGLVRDVMPRLAGAAGGQAEAATHSASARPRSVTGASS